jgi:PPOX class probable F420-dependent enzyme
VSVSGEGEARIRFAASPVARLATMTPDGAPHVVPVTFALDGDTLWWAVDFKPKRTPALQRLANIAAEPRASLLVDHYDDDWDQLWWVRADGLARVVSGDEAATGMAALVARYPRYRTEPPPGPVVEVAVQRWRWWSAR